MLVLVPRLSMVVGSGCHVPLHANVKRSCSRSYEMMIGPTYVLKNCQCHHLYNGGTTVLFDVVKRLQPIHLAVVMQSVPSTTKSTIHRKRGVIRTLKKFVLSCEFPIRCLPAHYDTLYCAVVWDARKRPTGFSNATFCGEKLQWCAMVNNVIADRLGSQLSSRRPTSCGHGSLVEERRLSR